jgi:hypothetical protein
VRVALEYDLGLARSYMAGEWVCERDTPYADGLRQLFLLFVDNRDVPNGQGMKVTRLLTSWVGYTVSTCTLRIQKYRCKRVHIYVMCMHVHIIFTAYTLYCIYCMHILWLFCSSRMLVAYLVLDSVHEREAGVHSAVLSLSQAVLSAASAAINYFTPHSATNAHYCHCFVAHHFV